MSKRETYSSAEAFLAIIASINGGFKKSFGDALTDTFHLLGRVEENDPNYLYCHVVGMDQKIAMNRQESKGWVTLGQIGKISDEQIEKFMKQHPKYFTEARYEWADNIVQEVHAELRVRATRELWDEHHFDFVPDDVLNQWEHLIGDLMIGHMLESTYPGWGRPMPFCSCIICLPHELANKIVSSAA